MCLVVVFFRAVDDAPVVVGANREELYGRGGTPPKILAGHVRVVAGTDPQAGGTWLGVNQWGVLVAVANRFKGVTPAQPRSRGLLALDLLQCDSARDATELAQRELGSGRYAGCNFLVADPHRANVLHAGDWLRVRPLPPGLHVLTASDANDASDRRLGHAHGWLDQRAYTKASDCLAALQELCAQTGSGDPPMCLRGTDRGTVSSTLIALRSPLSRSKYLHAQGPPDRTPFEDYSGLLKQIDPGAAAPGLG